LAGPYFPAVQVATLPRDVCDRRDRSSGNDAASNAGAFGVPVVGRPSRMPLALAAPGIHYFGFDDWQRVADIGSGLCKPVTFRRLTTQDGRGEPRPAFGP